MEGAKEILYFSMASHQAFGPHFDVHDVFAIHFEGEKVWNIYENIEKSPINHPVFKLSSDERRKRAGKRNYSTSHSSTRRFIIYSKRSIS